MHSNFSLKVVGTKIKYWGLSAIVPYLHRWHNITELSLICMCQLKGYFIAYLVYCIIHTHLWQTFCVHTPIQQPAHTKLAKVKFLGQVYNWSLFLTLSLVVVTIYFRQDNYKHCAPRQSMCMIVIGLYQTLRETYLVKVRYSCIEPSMVILPY